MKSPTNGLPLLLLVLLLPPGGSASGQDRSGVHSMTPEAAEQEVRRLERALQRRPGDPALFLAVIRAHEMAGGPERALHVLQERAGSLSPLMQDEEVRLLVNAGVSAWGRGAHEEALSLWTAANRTAPEREEGWRNRIAGLMELGRSGEAQRVREQALEYHSGSEAFEHRPDPTVLEVGDPSRGGRSSSAHPGLERAARLMEEGRLGDALPLLDSLAADPAAPPEVFQGAGGFWLSVQRPDSASILLRRGVELHPGHPELLLLLGHARAGEGEWEAAAESYGELARSSARARAPGEEVWGEAAWLRFRALLTGEERRAVQDALQSLSPSAMPDRALFIWAAGAVAAGDSTVARELLHAAASRGVYGARAALGRLAEDQGREADALRRYREDTDDPEGSAFGPAFLLDAAPPEGEEALRALERRALLRSITLLEGEELGTLAGGGEPPPPDLTPPDMLDIPPLLPDARTLVSRLLDEAIVNRPWGEEELERHRRIHPDSRILLRTRARVLLVQGQPSRALADLDRLLEAAPADGELHRMRGEALLALDLGGEAAGALFRALELDPRSERPFRALLALVEAGRVEGTADELLSRLRHLQSVHPEMGLLQERELELLHRTGRLEEAAARAAHFRREGS